MGAVLDAAEFGGPERHYTPADKFRMTYEEAANVAVGPENPLNGVLVYAASKALSEQAGWDFVEKENPSFAFSTVAPAWCLGKSHKVGAKTVADVGTTFHFTYTCVVDTPRVGPMVLPQYVNVEDVARTCVRALLQPEVSANKRYLLNAGKYTYEGIATTLRKQFPEQAQRIVDAEDKGVDHLFSVDGTLCEKDFGFKYIGFEQTIQEYGDNLFKLSPTAPAAA